MHMNMYIYLYVYKYVPLNSYGSYPLFLTIPICTVRQGAYFEQMLLLPCVLGEFRSKRPGDGGTFFVCRMADHRIEDSRDEALDRGYGWRIVVQDISIIHSYLTWGNIANLTMIRVT